MKKVLIVSYTFPPNNGVGGRRWAKFAKELNKSEHDIQVLTFNNKNRSKRSNWSKDIESFSDRVHSFPTSYPKWLESPKGVIHKVLYRLSLIHVKTFTKGNYYDRASFLRKTTIDNVESFIKQGYNNIIVTCAPFKLALWVNELLPKYPHVNFIVDFRDPWTNNLTSYGLSSMSKGRVDFENNSEKNVVHNFNKIVVVAEEMKSYFIRKYDISSDKISVINNGFDEDDFKNVSDVTDMYFKKDGKIKIVFTGTFYDKAIYLLKELANVIENNEHISKVFEFHFFGSMPEPAHYLFKKNNGSLFFHGSIELGHVYAVIAKSDFCSLFLTDDINYSFSTKFLEYLSQGKQILVFSNGGSTGEFVEKNSLGFDINSKNILSVLNKVIETYNSGNNKVYKNAEFSLDDFSVKNLTKRIEQLLV